MEPFLQSLWNKTDAERFNAEGQTDRGPRVVGVSLVETSDICKRGQTWI